MTTPEQNKTLAPTALDTLFNKRVRAAPGDFWSERYVQHDAHTAPGRAGLLDLIRSLPDTLHYEHQLVLAEGDHVMLHGRFTGTGGPAASAADVVPHRKRLTHRTLGRPTGRDDPRRVRRRPAHVRRPVPA
ncbi:nuclear transport factor 2 family protein [Streptomyces sp. S1D4-11]|nr:nuclear transport factor 2 family protein [Streptomyces sp. S1D4-11]